MSLSNLSSPPISIILLLSLLFFFSHFPSLTSSFNISQVLSQYPAYSSFSNYLAQTQLAADIDSRRPITVLVVDNSGVSPLSGKSMDVIKKVLSIHVLLDYYDVQKLQGLRGKSVMVTTLYQTTGLPSGQEGFVNISGLSTGAVSFTSPSNESGSVGANLVKSVAFQPYNLSVVQISTIIMPPALLSTTPSPSSSPKPAPVQSPAPEASPVPVISPVPVKSPVPVPVPVLVPVPVRSPVPVISPVQVISPEPVASSAMSPPADNGVPANSGVNMALTIMITLLWAIYSMQ